MSVPTSFASQGPRLARCNGIRHDARRSRGGVALAGSTVVGAAHAHETVRQPNILFILADDWSFWLRASQ